LFGSALKSTPIHELRLIFHCRQRHITEQNRVSSKDGVLGFVFDIRRREEEEELRVRGSTL
jgi:hypothetical protein